MIDRSENLKLAPPWGATKKVDSSHRVQPTKPERARKAASSKELKSKLSDLCGSQLALVETHLLSSVASNTSAIQSLCQHATSMGGKRLRPTLVILAALAQKALPKQVAFSKRQQADLTSLCCSVELVHAASLLHDDVMDNAETRRHKPTVGKVAGSSAAILLGDYLFTKAYGLAATARSSFAARSIAKAATALCEGELQQQFSAGQWDISMKEYKKILELKTGALTAVSCQLGGWIVGSSKHEMRNLYRFGNQLGLAFQIFDDWLDYWGTDEAGKTLGTDLQNGKVTLPLLRLLSQTNGSRRTELEQTLESICNQPDIESAAADRQKVLDMLANSDASEFTLHIAARCVENAKKTITDLPVSPAKECLLDIARFAIARAI